MKIYYFMLITLGLLGCSRQITTLEEEIAHQPDSWSESWRTGASSNNWALLDRAANVENGMERIRCVRTLMLHFRHSPERVLSDCGKDKDIKTRIRFAQACTSRLIEDKYADPTVICEGWKYEADLLNDLEEMIRLTENVWNEGVGTEVAPGKRDKWNFSYDIRNIYNQYFKYSFNVQATYKRLPEYARPAFVEQIKRDFFHRKGMAFVDLSAFPPEFRK